MTTVRIAIALPVVAIFVAIATPARAQSVEAEVLFREGKKLLKDGKLAEACEKFEASDRVESSVGSLLNLADCREKNHQLASAWNAFHKAAAAAKRESDGKREAEARRREKLLEARLSYLTVNVVDANRVDGLAVARNGAALDSALWNQAVPVDAATYEVVAQAPGKQRWSKQIKVDAEGKTFTVDVPKLEAPGAHPPDKPTVATVTPPAHTDDQASTQVSATATTPSIFTPKRKIAVTLGAIGVGSIALGAVFGLHANDLESQADKICPTAACADQHAVSLNHDAQSSALIANIGYIGGGVFVAGAVALWFMGAPAVEHDNVAVRPAVAPGFSGFSVSGRF